MGIHRTTDRRPVVIAGAGPAGSSLAIRLASAGLPVVLVEKETFPRDKLCGEFISPECLTHFAELDVLEPMLAAGGDRIDATFFYSMSGRSVAVPSEVFGGAALSLSRAAMDSILLDGARQAGADVVEGASIRGIEIDGGEIREVAIDAANVSRRVEPRLLVDATGRARALVKLAARAFGSRLDNSRPPERIVGLKCHLRGAAVPRGACEIYSFPGGYSGLSNVEGSAANHCMLIRAEAVRRCGENDALVSEIVMQNPRAAETLGPAVRAGEWLAVAVPSFGSVERAPLGKLLTVGDAAAFIDPFTGSGMLLALESSALLAECIAGCRERSFAAIAGSYEASSRARFRRRLLVSSILRRAAFMPRAAETLVRALSLSSAARSGLARLTRAP